MYQIISCLYATEAGEGHENPTATWDINGLFVCDGCLDRLMAHLMQTPQAVSRFHSPGGFIKLEDGTVRILHRFLSYSTLGKEPGERIVRANTLVLRAYCGNLYLQIRSGNPTFTASITIASWMGISKDVATECTLQETSHCTAQHSPNGVKRVVPERVVADLVERFGFPKDGVVRLVNLVLDYHGWEPLPED